MKLGWRHVRALSCVVLAAGCASGGGDPDEAPLGQLLSELVSGAGEATLTLQSNWGSGYCADVSIANKGSTVISSWSVLLDLKQATVSSLWNGTRAGSTVTPAAHNQSIQPNAKVSFGFCATISNSQNLPSIASLTVNGGGSPPTSNPPPPTTPPPSNPPPAPPPAAPPPPTTSPDGGTQYPPIQGGCSGYATRFWDCCKPHCGWSGNVPSGVNPINSCSKTNAPQSNANQQSSCNGGDAHMCYGLAPYSVNSNLAFGYAATSSGDVCGRCYQLQFDGTSRNAGNDPGSKALQGKTMVVQAINIGYDVGGGQFDLLVPGGGVGAFNACSSQWGVSSSELGVQYGGFLAACKQQLGYNASLGSYKSCVAQKCTSVFQSRGLTDLAAGCNWFVDWFQAADNPSLKYKEVACPAELSGESGMNRSSRNDISRACGN